METETNHIEIKEYVGKHNLGEIKSKLSNNDIVVLPENFMGKDCFNKDLINLAKILRAEGVKVGFHNDQLPIVEKRAADIIIYLGIIGSQVVLPLIVGIIGSYLYDKFVRSKDKKDIPKVKLEYYKKDSEENIKYEGPADELSDYLTKIKEKDNESN